MKGHALLSQGRIVLEGQVEQLSTEALVVASHGDVVAVVEYPPRSALPAIVGDRMGEAESQYEEEAENDQ